MSKVFWVPASASMLDEELESAIAALWDAAGLDGVFREGDLAALKLHVGEPGTKTFVPPAVAAALVRRMEKAGTRPFLTDTAVLYRSPRDNGVGHAEVAREHGFGRD